MIASNVIDFAHALQRRHSHHASRRVSRLLRYRDGIDGLVKLPQAKTSSATILPFETITRRPSA